MAIIRPFRALRYGPDLDPALEQLVSPPGGGRIYPRTGLDGLHPYNILRLVRGRFDPANERGAVPYEATRRCMEDWKRRGVLVRDPRPAFYVLEQRYPFGGEELVRRGVIGHVHLEPMGKRNIFPHERTLRGPKPDLLEQLRALEANLSLTLGLVDDPDEVLRTLLGGAPAEVLLADVVDGQGVRNRVYRAEDEGFARAVEAALRPRPIVIADGHHRYETALVYQRERRRLLDIRGSAPSDFVMMLVVPTEDAGRSVLPPNRAIRHLPEGWRGRLDEQLVRFFQVDELSDIAALDRFLARGTRPRFGVVLPGRQLALRLRRSQRVQRLLDAEPATWRGLEITAARAVLMREVLQICPNTYAAKEHTLFPTSTAEVVEAVRGGEYQIGILIRPTPALCVTAVAQGGHVMPPKSTNFYPKPCKGLVMNSLKGF